MDSERVIAVRPRSGLTWTIKGGPEGGIVVDSGGATVTFDGEIFRQACFDAVTGTYYIGPEDLPDPQRPPN